MAYATSNYTFNHGSLVIGDAYLNYVGVLCGIEETPPVYEWNIVQTLK